MDQLALWGAVDGCSWRRLATGPAATSHEPPSGGAGDAVGDRHPQAAHGGLFPPFADALLGQHLAQPGMLVVHVPSPDWVVSSIAT
jgi:hypothetical protein